MKGITFGEYHSYRDLHLILAKKEMGAPPVKEKKIDIDGADSDIDYTDYFGEPKYGNATHKFDFSTMVPQTDFLSQFSLVKNALHGKKLRIILDDDPSYYYVGRIHCQPFTSARGIGYINIECDCEPYKYKIAPTVISRAIDGAETITLTNGRKRAVPELTIQTDTSLNIVYQGVNVWDLGSGSFTLPELELVEGDNLVTVTGTGSISFTWQEGGL